MELKRRGRDRIPFVLLILGNIATALSGQNLDCTNDYEAMMFCSFEAQNCTEYNLTLRSNDGYGERHCIFKQCDVGQCCCSIHQMTLVMGETHTAIVWKGGESMESKISVTDSIKPKTPTITSVKETNGNFQVQWKTNQEGYLSNSLSANVTYHKKGDTTKVSVFVKPTILNGLNYYEILGRHLEPSTTYAVSVNSYADISGRFSDSSEEWEFTTPVSPIALALAIIICLSIAAVIISGAVYGCYVKIKTKWWDTVAKCPNPKLLIMHPSKQELLKPVPPIISSLCVEPLVSDDSKSWSKGSSRDTSSGSPQQSSGISSGSSDLSYAHTEPANVIAGVQDALGKVFPKISPISPLTTNSLNLEDSDLISSPYNPCDFRPEETSCGSSGFDNKTYSILIPSCLQPIFANSSVVLMHHPSVGDIVTCADQQVPACPRVNLPPVVSSPVPTDMSYQQSNANSGGFSSAEDFSLSSSGTNTTASCDPVFKVEAGFESLDEASRDATKLGGRTEGATICDENPCYGCVPTASHSFPPVDDDYQSFQNLVEQPDILFSEERGGETEEHVNRSPEESFTKMPQSFLRPVVSGFINSNQGSQCLSEPQRPFLTLIPADQSLPIITDSGYQSV